MTITFASQKGGVGKSTLLISVATSLHYNLNKSVRVIDSDIPQNNISKLRDFEVQHVKSAIKAYKEGKETPFYMPKIVNSQKSIYPIEIIDILDISDKIKSYEEEYVFIDSLGTLNTDGYDELFNVSDYFIIPMSVDFFDYTATLEYVKIMNKAKKEGIIKGFYIVLNKVNQRSQNDAEEVFELFDQNKIPYFKSYIPLGEAYKREPMTNEKYYRTGVRSTVIPTNNFYINALSEELVNKIKS